MVTHFLFVYDQSQSHFQTYETYETLYKRHPHIHLLRSPLSLTKRRSIPAHLSVSVSSLLNEEWHSLEHVGAAGELSRCWKAAETSPETCK
ncbi:hypothetical protein Hdeb2414_s0002g00045291 [Helianthus debilis subsp. tardiflorus]